MISTKNDVFERRTLPNSGSQVELSRSTYNFVLGLCLFWGFLINYLMVKNIDPSLAMRFGFLPFIIAYFASCFFGIYLFSSSDKPLVSFIGYNFIVVPFGFIVNLVVSAYEPALVVEAMQITAVVTFTMMALGTIYPKFFQKIRTALTVALIVTIIVELIAVYVFKKEYGIIDWIVALIFCGYIGYDWGRANQIPRTLDNAIDSAAALYMDIINLFLRILRILGRRK